ncbi:UDP-N-acetylglucosamine 4,6-dehydratase (inverting) [Candidatus Kaiserbacteria bacterium]|nr:UDP-N-acetylglucosamine 4,6-dehydratase (inverting) [Candidatus Kaiserbacteria bacterium]
MATPHLKAHTFLKGKTVLVTGGTGTFGQAFVKRLLQDNQIKKLIVFSRDEFKQHQMLQKISDPRKKLRFFIGDVRDRGRLERAFNGVDIVVHAAALKQVPAIEYNPTEAIKTNINGSQNVIDAALDMRVEKVMLVSSDKAVQPINLYGATKLAAEKLFVAANVYRDDKRNTALSVVRYGNVVGSRGSFVELLRTQRETGTITLTNEKMTRFWITIDKVMDVVLESLSLMHGGEIFVPKMGNMPVYDVVKMLVPECKIKVTGIRPGEKLHEVLITEYEAPRAHDIGYAYVIKPEFLPNADTSWINRKPSVGDDFVFASNNVVFQLKKKHARKILVL